MPAETVLVLGGTAEASILVQRIAAAFPRWRVILSLAGRTLAPVLPGGGEVRIGGFGGREGLAAFIRLEGVTHLVDATHPFAAGISRNAAEAAATTGVRRIALLRPAWEEQPGERWIKVDCLAAAAESLPPGARTFLALGRQHLSPFARRNDVSFTVRMVDPPTEPLPFPAELVLGKPGPAEAEEELFRALAVTHLVSRNSGGAASYAKIEAARRLGLAVVMIERAAAPPPPLAATLGEVMAWLNA
ncbi:cobalt-precorrin-6A reductase [Aureimonas psammosilenae]|uniref:cobalt-precorrin-6A reductase n=1 Tax=Aureimonas psammosilenae TaxID=2495496 RepID=UPI001260FD98|nr:cobalt-precorrin-6A reductase [Aureimonas psammosilenae]